MTKKRMAGLSLLFAAGMAALGLWVASGLPAGQDLPVHWGIRGEPDGFASKWVALMLPAALSAVLTAFFYALPTLEPQEGNFQRSQGLYLAAWASVLLVMGAVELMTLSVALHWGLRVISIMALAVALMFVLIGNQLGKSRRMYLVGIRTPWTLASEEVWIKTHRLGGKLMVGGGLVLLAAALAPIPAGLLAAAFVVALSVIVAVPVVYSYLLWRRETLGEGKGHSAG